MLLYKKYFPKEVLYIKRIPQQNPKIFTEEKEVVFEVFYYLKHVLIYKPFGYFVTNKWYQ